MDFQYSEEQRMLADSLRRYAAQGWSMETRRAAATSGQGYDERNWGVLRDMGVLGLIVPAEYEGYGENPASLLPVNIELGRALAGEPVVPGAVVSAAILTQHGSDAQKQQWLPKLASGEAILSLAYLEPAQRYATAPRDTRVEKTADGYRLNGQKAMVWYGAAARALFVSAVDGAGKASVFLVPTDAAGVSLKDYPTMDCQRAAELGLTDVQLPAEALVGAEGEAQAVLDTGMDYGIAALSAHAAGAMERLIEITADYLRTRKQFGQPLAKFQGLQHRVAEMVIQKERALSMACVAVSALTEPDAERRRRMISGAKVVIAEAGRFVGQQAVQLHGGMGMTAELEVGDYFKRLTLVDPLFGDMDFHVARFSEHMA
ncbi:acyl-CoA dehydrogenase [Verticiella sediminum]|uniref:Acyl-CoA dehydrogenase n=1 Tax=Verticiella sediminum TaxID=1247510 RepID=A0A556AYU0_9BURK|nr:acyl-CoA dehydrogenase [Verticiella sediminum]TSH98114.1 acyl-CoA dehydrogenase [Verticiella sediminum]